MTDVLENKVYASTVNGRLTADELHNRENEFPYCSMIQFQLIQEYMNADKESLEIQMQKAGVYFPDLLKLNWQLHLHSTALNTEANKTTEAANLPVVNKDLNKQEEEPYFKPSLETEKSEPDVLIDDSSNQFEDDIHSPQRVESSFAKNNHRQVFSINADPVNDLSGVHQSLENHPEETERLIDKEPEFQSLNAQMQETINEQADIVMPVELKDIPQEKNESVAEPVNKNEPAIVPAQIIQVKNPLHQTDEKEPEESNNPLLANLKQELQKPVQSEDIVYEPLYTKDYFASQGIKLTGDPDQADKLGKQLKSFTQWLKSMKKINIEKLSEPDDVVDKRIQTIAEESNANVEVITETMAEVLLLQGKHEKALEMYEKLSLINPSKSAYFAAIIQVIKKG